MTSTTRPAWLADELDEEWVDLDNPEPSLDPTPHPSPPLAASLSEHSSDLSSSHTFRTCLNSSCTSAAVQAGTFLVRDDVAAQRILPKTPGRAKKGLMKDFFSPLPLQAMFEPPSPPIELLPVAEPEAAQLTSKFSTITEAAYGEGDEGSDMDEDRDLTDEIVATDIPNLATFDGRRPSTAYAFTFNAPHERGATPTQPAPPAASSTDPRLRLFQFQYDTFTREHLSAMVDSIAGNTPAVERMPRLASGAHMRSAKRIRLSPPIERSLIPPSGRVRDYIGESKSLMQQIKEARSFTATPAASPTISSDATHAEVEAQSLERHDRKRRFPGGGKCFFARLYVADRSVVVTTTQAQDQSQDAHVDASLQGKPIAYSSLAYRRQAADLMAKIASDMRAKRIFSAQTDVTLSSACSPEKAGSIGSKALARNVDGESKSQLVPANPGRPRVGPSPRRLLRRLSAADEVDRELALENLSLAGPVEHELSAAHPVQLPVITRQMSPSTPLVDTAPNSPVAGPLPGFLHAGLRPMGSARQTDDLNRFVSASTIISATGSAGTSATVGSGVKHAGPVQMTRIAPGDVPAIPERVGKMVFDKDSNRWVKAVDGEGESEDPFRDIESLREDSPSHHQDELEEFPLRSPELAAEDEEFERDDVSFSFDDDGSVAGVVEIMTGVYGESDAETTIDWDIDDMPTQAGTAVLARPSPFDTRSPMPRNYTPEAVAFSTPLPPQKLAALGPPRSALKSTPVADPRTVRIDTSGARHHRSVSFSDGRKDGKIRGLERRQSAPDAVGGDESVDSADDVHGEGSVLRPGASLHSVSVATSPGMRRITNILVALDEPSWEIDTPSKAGSMTARTSFQALGTGQRLQAHLLSGADLLGGVGEASTSRRSLHRSLSHRPAHAADSMEARNAPNMTLLTECSFRFGHDRLVQAITDVEPYEPHWDQLRRLDLSDKAIESIVSLKEFLPRLEELKIDKNCLQWLTGAPKTLRSLAVTNNALTSVTAFNHVLRLELLDLGNNQIDSLRQLECLTSLRELSAEGNSISSIEGIERLRELEKLSLRSNKICDVDLRHCQWPKLESFNLSKNGLRAIRGLDLFAGSLCTLNLDSNSLTALNESSSRRLELPKLRVLRISDNRLTQLDVGGFVALRTLYADGNCLPECLGELYGMESLRRLENLSLRNQSSRGGLGSRSASRDFRDVKRLYLSANRLPADLLQEACYNLVYLELAACRLENLPTDLCGLAPNVRVLNLNYNFLSDVAPLAGLCRLRKLTIIGSRLKGIKGLIRVLRGMPDMEMVDFRMNPFSLGWYLPLLVRDVPGALQPSESARGGGSSWEELDRKFRGDLPDRSYLGRLAYRGLVMQACSRIVEMDGVMVSSEERAKAQRLLTSVQHQRGHGPQ